MRVGAEGRFPSPAEQFGSVGLPVRSSAQHQRIDDKTDEPFDFRAIAIRDRAADADVIHAAVTVQRASERRPRAS